MHRHLLTVALIAGCQRFTDPAAYHFAEAQALADAGKHDDAIAAFEVVAKDYPASPEAGQVPNAITEATFDKAKAAWDAGRFLDAGLAYVSYAARPGVEKANERDVMLFLAGGYAAYHAETPRTDDGLKFVTDMAAAWTGEEAGSLGSFKREVTGWACDNRTGFPAWGACTPATDVDGGLVVAVARADRAEAACVMLATLAPSCSPEVGAEINALPNGSLATLRANIATERAPLELTYENVTGVWDCKVVVWEFTPAIVSGKIRLAKRMSMTGDVTNMAYLLTSDGGAFITDFAATKMSWTDLKVSKGEMVAAGVATDAGLAEGEWRCLRVNDVTTWKPRKLWETD